MSQKTKVQNGMTFKAVPTMELEFYDLDRVHDADEDGDEEDDMTF